MPGAPPHRLDQRRRAPQITFLVRVEDRHERHFRQVQPLAQEIDADQHVEFAPPQVAQNLHSLQRFDLRVQIPAAHAHFGKIFREVFRHALRERGDQHSLVALGAHPNLLQQIVHLPLYRAYFDLRIHQPGRPDHLLRNHAASLRQLVRPRRRRNVDRLVHPVLKLLERQRPVVQRRRHPEAVVHQRLLPRAVPVKHPANLRHRLVRFVDEKQVILRHVIEQRRGSLARQPPGQVPRIVLYAVAIADGVDHLDVEECPLRHPLRFDKLSLLFQLLLPPLELFVDSGDGAFFLPGGQDVMRLRVDRKPGQVFTARAHFSGQRIDLPQSVHLISPHLDAVALIFVRRIDFDHVAAHPKRAAPQILAAFVLNLDQPPQQRFPRRLLPLLQHHQHPVIRFWRPDAVNARNAGHNDYVAPLEQRPRRAHPQLVQLVVDRRFLLDVDVCRGNVRFRLVIIVVADEIFDRILREEPLELMVELRGQCLIVGQDQGRPVRLLDDLGHRKGFSRARHAQQHLMFVAGFQPPPKLLDRSGLIAARLIVAA